MATVTVGKRWTTTRSKHHRAAVRQWVRYYKRQGQLSGSFLVDGVVHTLPDGRRAKSQAACGCQKRPHSTAARGDPPILPG